MRQAAAVGGVGDARILGGGGGGGTPPRHICIYINPWIYINQWESIGLYKFYIGFISIIGFYKSLDIQ